MRVAKHISTAIVMALICSTACADILGLSQPEYGGKTLTQWLDSTTNGNSAAFDDALWHMGSNAAPFLADIIQFQESPVRARAEQLAKDKLHLQVPNYEWRRRAALRALYRLGPDGKAAIPALAKIASNSSFPDHMLRTEAIDALGMMAPDSVPALTNLILRKVGTNIMDDLANRRAIMDLFAHDPNVKEVSAVFLAIFQGADVRAKVMAAAALGFWRGHQRYSDSIEFIPAMIKCLSTNTDAERDTLTRNAARVLGNFGPKAEAAVPALLGVIADGIPGGNDYNRCEAVGKALSQIDSDAGIRGLVAQLKSANPIARRNASWGLRAFKGKATSAVQPLLNALDDPDPEVRGEAVVTLREIHQQPAVVIPAFIRKLTDPDEKVQWTSAIALGAFGSEAKSAVPAILQVLKTYNGSNKDAFYRALDEIDPDTLQKITPHGRPFVPESY